MSSFSNFFFLQFTLFKSSSLRASKSTTTVFVFILLVKGFDLRSLFKILTSGSFSI